MKEIIVKREENQVYTEFYTKFYPEDCIIKALTDFSQFCWISMDGDSKKLQIKLKPKSANICLDTLGYEFYNYVLGIIKNKGKVREIIEKLNR